VDDEKSDSTDDDNESDDAGDSSDLKDMPVAHRPSQKVKKSNARDLIFKGYVIPYLIADSEILILGIYKANEWQA